jgi:Macrocin-O-methyltransferase (TylF)
MAPEPTGAREIRAEGPGSGAEELRDAYLDLLKLALCDLTGVGTESVTMTIDGEGLMSRESTPEELEFRAAGRHWPRRGLTMVGLARLDDLQSCVERVVADGVQGDLIEAGVWRGGASMLMRATLDTLGQGGRLVWATDSFSGFPGPAAEASPPRGRRDLSQFDFLAVPLDEVRANFARFGLDHGVRFVPGLFEVTMPKLRGGRWSVIRLDGDTYDATRVTLDSLYPGLSAGGYLIVDDYELLAECRRAVDEYRAEHGIDEPIEPVDWTCVRWRRQSAPASGGGEWAPEIREAEPNGIPGERPPVPTEREVRLAAEAEHLRQQLDAARQQIAELEAR